MSISIIAPCYNEELNIDEYLSRIIKTLKKINIDYKIIFIDDGSKDKTWDKIVEKCKGNKKIHGVKFSRNFGHQAAIMAGLNQSNSEYTFVSDVDLQDPPELLEEMYVKIISQKCNVIFAKRIENNEKFFKKYSSFLFYKFFNLIADIKINEQTSDFILIDQIVLFELKKIKDKDIFLRGIIPWYGFNIDFIEFKREKRKKGISGWELGKMIQFSLTALLSFSNFPKRLSFFLSLISLVMFIFSTLFAMYSYFFFNYIKNLSIIFLTISFFNTVIFFFLGLIAEYVERIYINAKERPLYFVDKTFSGDDL